MGGGGGVISRRRRKERGLSGGVRGVCKSVGRAGVALFLSDVTASYCICILYRIVKSLSPQSVSGFGGSHIQWLDCVGHLPSPSPPRCERRARASIYTGFDLTYRVSVAAFPVILL